MVNKKKKSSNRPKLTDAQVIHMRRVARADISKHAAHFASIFNIDPEIAGKALRGDTYSHLNEFEPGVFKVIAKLDLKEQARKLYKDGYTYAQIIKELHVSKASVSKWCGDLAIIRLKEKVAAHGLTIEQKKFVNSPHAKRGFGSKLPDEDVLTMRREIRAAGIVTLSKYAKQFGVNIETVSAAVHGKRYKHLDDQEAPITEDLPKANRGKHVKSDDLVKLIDTMLEMRRADPATWTYKALAVWLDENNKRKYFWSHVRYLMIQQDQSILEVKAAKPPKPPKPHKAIKLPKPPKVKKPRAPKKPRPSRRKDLYKCECVICEKPFQSKLPEMEICSASCRKILHEYGEYDNEVENNSNEQERCHPLDG